MVNSANWLLPEGVEEILPAEALKLEALRRRVLDDLAAKDFQLVMPPVMEFCLLYTSPSPRDQRGSRMPSSA